MNKYKYLFGPVLSRRFGRSLGVDLVPLKACTFDCVFCQLGHTPAKTLIRKEYVPVKRVTTEIASWLRAGQVADCITLSGSGEPTLHSRFGDVIDFIHSHTPTPVLLLTNSSLFHISAVRRAAARADIVKVSLSAWDQASFDKVNSPCDGIHFADVIAGLVKFRSEFKGRLVMEVFLVRGINSQPSDVAKIAHIAAGIRPDQIQFNTAVRPPADRSVFPVSAGRMRSLAKLFHPAAESIPATVNTTGGGANSGADAIMALLSRHACTVSQVAKAFNIPLPAARKRMGELVRAGMITERRMKHGVYYSP